MSGEAGAVYLDDDSALPEKVPDRCRSLSRCERGSAVGEALCATAGPP